MQFANHYIRLRMAFPHVMDTHPVEVTHQQLSDILHCTIRHVKNILKQLIALSWIEWTPGNGRGNRSQLRFLLTRDQLFSIILEHLTKSGTVSPTLFEPIQMWFLDQFGYQQRLSNSASLDLFRYPLDEPFYTLDPAHVTYTAEIHLCTQVFDTLFRVNPETEMVESHLCYTWEVDKTGKIWSIYLRKGVFFHHGKTLTSRDVYATFSRLLDPGTKSPFFQTISQIAQVNRVSESHVEIVLHQPNFMFHHILCSANTAILPHDVLQQEWAGSFRPVGTGPFQVIHIDQLKLTLDSFPKYFKGRSFLDRVEIWKIEYLEEHLHGSFSIKHYFTGSRDTSKESHLIRKTVAGVRLMSCNMDKEGPLQNSKFRQAFDLFLDRVKMVKDLGCERFHEASRILYSEDNKYTKVDQGPLSDFLKESGYEGEPLLLVTFQSPANMMDAEWIQRAALEHGITIEIKLLPFDFIHQYKEFLDADLILYAIGFDDTKEKTLYSTFMGEHEFIRHFLGRDQIKQFEENILLEPHPKNRIAALLQMEQYIIETHAIIPLYYVSRTIQVHPSLEGIPLNPNGLVDFHKVWLKQTTEHSR